MASAPFHQLGDTLVELESAGVDCIHFDIEDGSFVPMMTLGTKIIQELRPKTRLPFDVHLMMVNPEWLLPDLARWGVISISVHYEACPYPRRVLRQITSLGLQAGLAINPATPIPDLDYLAPYLSFMVLLSTEPEGDDCPFIPETLDKMRKGKQTHSRIKWVMDGDINSTNIAEVVAAGADEVVIGRAIFKDNAISENMRTIRAAIS